MNIYIVELLYGTLHETSVVVARGQESALKLALQENRLGLDIEANARLIGAAESGFEEECVLLRKLL